MHISMKSNTSTTSISVNGKTYNADEQGIFRVEQTDVSELINHGFVVVQDNRVQISPAQEEGIKKAQENLQKERVQLDADREELEKAKAEFERQKAANDANLNKANNKK